MSSEKALPKHEPERPIYLNEANTGLKTKDEVLLAIEKLRNFGDSNGSGRHWLVAYNENSRPFHMSFNSEKMFQVFKKDCANLNIKLKQPTYTQEDIENLDVKENETVRPEPKSTIEDTSGKIHITD